MNNCEHQGQFSSTVWVERNHDGRFMAHFTIRCDDCGEKMEFFGTAFGLDWNGARTSIDRQELRIAIGTKETIEAYYKLAIEESIRPKIIKMVQYDSSMKSRSK